MKRLLVFIVLFECLYSLDINLNSISTLTEDKIFSDTYVQIQVSATVNSLDYSSNVQDFDKFVLKSLNNNKRKAYLQLLKNYDKLVNLLKKQIIIGDENLLIKSKIKQKYLRKKRQWQFSILFMIKQSSVFTKQHSREMNKLGIIKINSRQKTLLLNSKILAINTFFQAKYKVQAALSKYKKLCIDSVKSIELSDFNLDDAELINIGQDDDTTQSSDKDAQQEYNSYFFNLNYKPKKSNPKLTAIFKIKKNCDGLDDQNSNYFQHSSSDSQYQEDQSRSQKSLSDNSNEEK